MDKFYGSKVNTALLVILIILMVVALKVMLLNKDTYFPFLTQKVEDKVKPVEDASMDRTKLLGNKDDLVSFSIWPGAKVHGVMSYRGVIKGGYFFEGNILVNVLDKNKNVILKSNAVAKDDWMTAGPVSFEGNIDFSKFVPGVAFLEIHNDNASGLPQNDKSVLIPILVQ